MNTRNQLHDITKDGEMREIISAIIGARGLFSL
jgi:hypothetical protein